MTSPLTWEDHLYRIIEHLRSAPLVEEMGYDRGHDESWVMDSLLVSRIGELRLRIDSCLNAMREAGAIDLSRLAEADDDPLQEGYRCLLKLHERLQGYEPESRTTLDPGCREVLAAALKAGGRSKQAGTTLAAPSEANLSDKPESEYVFRQEGEIWTLRYEGETTKLKNRKGLRYLHELISTPRKEIPAFQLAGEGKAASRGGRERDEATVDLQGGLPDVVFDREALRSIKNRQDEIERELGKARQDQDEAAIDRLTLEKEENQAQLNSKTGLFGVSRAFSDEVEKARKAVSNAISCAIAKIEEDAPMLAKHLQSVRTGTQCSYQPDRELPWEL